jgi:hypothetical protein
MRINGRASMLNDAEAKARYFGAQLMVRIECEIYPNCPRYVPDLAGEDLSPYVWREGQGTPPPPEWKSPYYVRDILPAAIRMRRSLRRTRVIADGASRPLGR